MWATGLLPFGLQSSHWFNRSSSPCHQLSSSTVCSPTLNKDATDSQEAMMTSDLLYIITRQQFSVLMTSKVQISLNTVTVLCLLQTTSKLYCSSVTLLRIVKTVQSYETVQCMKQKVIHVSEASSAFMLSLLSVILLVFGISSDNSHVRTTDERSILSHINVPFYKLFGELISTF
jgi:hypothetical protein